MQMWSKMTLNAYYDGAAIIEFSYSRIQHIVSRHITTRRFEWEFSDNTIVEQVKTAQWIREKSNLTHSLNGRMKGKNDSKAKKYNKVEFVWTSWKLCLF